jgi:hypothetical protein
MEYRIIIDREQAACGADIGRQIQDQLFTQTGIRISSGFAVALGQSYFDEERSSFELSPVSSYRSRRQQLETRAKVAAHPVAEALESLQKRPVTIGVVDDKYREEPQPATKTRRIDLLTLAGLPTRSPASFSDKRKSRIESHEALVHASESLRNQNILSAGPMGDNGAVLRRGKIEKLLFSRDNYAAYRKERKKSFVRDWMNIVVIEDATTQTKTAYTYDASSGLTDDAFIYGLSNHEIVSSGMIKITSHTVTKGIKIPGIYFVPRQENEAPTTSLSNYHLLTYFADTLAVPVCASVNESVQLTATPGRYYYQEENAQYDAIIDAIKKIYSPPAVVATYTHANPSEPKTPSIFDFSLNSTDDDWEKVMTCS